MPARRGIARVRYALAAAVLTGAGAVALSPGTSGAAPVSQDFGPTDAPQELVVPADVCQVTIDAFGAQGGVGTGVDHLVGGLGGRATASIAVTPGETLQVNVGGKGGDGTRLVAGAGGSNGGADGGVGSDETGGGGGGASDVRQGGTGLAQRAVVAGGGGGSGGGDGGGDGGGGGGNVGGDGADGSTGLDGGKGGTQSAGGAAGADDPSAEPGSSGSGGKGGDGTTYAGAGGGGGYFGGGGGSGDAAGLGADGGGGGGGSGFGPAGTAFETDVNDGDGHVTISYDPAAGGCPAPVVAVVAAPRFTG